MRNKIVSDLKYAKLIPLRSFLVLTLKNESAPAGVSQWTECQPVNQRVTGSIPSQGTCLGCRPGPWWRVHKRQPQVDVFLSLSLLSLLSKIK